LSSRLKTLSDSNLEYHQWIEFFDSGRIGFAEPEAFIELESKVVLFESKYTGIPAGKDQMVELYAPLLHLLLGKPIQMLQICRWRDTKTPGPFIDDPVEFIKTNIPYATWHWLG